MRIELGAQVRTQEGTTAGKVNRLVLGSDGHTLDSFVVHTQWMGQKLIVPIRDVARVDADDTIHLTITEAQCLSLPQYFETDFSMDNPSSWEESQFSSQGAGMGITAASTPSHGGETSLGQEYDAAGGSLIGMGNVGSSTIRAESTLEEGEFGITKSTRVVSKDGHHVGNVHELSVTDDGKLTGLIVTSGHIVTHRHAVPIENVEDADPDEVRLRITAAEFQHLAPINPADGERP